jgi:hypothetical protein
MIFKKKFKKISNNFFKFFFSTLQKIDIHFLFFKKIHKYRHLANDFHFIPIGTETLGTFGPEAIKFLEDLGHKLGLINGEKRSKSFLFQSIGISIQKGNAACILGTKGIYGKLGCEIFGFCLLSFCQIERT